MPSFHPQRQLTRGLCLVAVCLGLGWPWLLTVPVAVGQADTAASQAAEPAGDDNTSLDDASGAPQDADLGLLPATAEADTAASPPPAPSALFRVCGGDDPAVERAIEQAVAGRAFSLNLVGRPDGCADLTLQVPAAAPLAPGSRVESRLTIDLGSGPGAAVDIVSENGATRASIRPGR